MIIYFYVLFLLESISINFIKIKLLYIILNLMMYLIFPFLEIIITQKKNFNL